MGALHDLPLCSALSAYESVNIDLPSKFKWQGSDETIFIRCIRRWRSFTLESTPRHLLVSAAWGSMGRIGVMVFDRRRR